MGNGQGIARSPLCQRRHSLSSRSIAIIIMMTIESCAHMGDLTRKFRAHAYTSVWLERLKRRAKYRQWDAVTVPGKEACQGSRWNGPESAHALAHRRCHRPC